MSAPLFRSELTLQDTKVIRSVFAALIDPDPNVSGPMEVSIMDVIRPVILAELRARANQIKDES